MSDAMKALENMFSAVELVLYGWMSSFTIVVVLDDKGGVGKSLISQVAASLFEYFGFRIAIGDTDTNNSTSTQVLANSHVLDLNEKKSSGRLLRLMAGAAANEFDHVVIDVGAREEAEIKTLLPWLVQAARKLRGRVVVLRPITLGSHNQRNACNFLNIAEALQIPVVFVRNEGQGRQPEYFDRWLTTGVRSAALARGAVETMLSDADVRYADEAVGLGLSIAACALQDWSKLMPREGMSDEDRKIAEQDVADASDFFSDDVAAFLGEWLRVNMCSLGDAIEEAIVKREALDTATAQDEEPQPRKAKKK